MPEKIAVLIVDNHEFFRKTLREYLSGIDVVTIIGEANNGMEAVTAVEMLKPGLIIMDTGVPGAEGITAYEIIRSKHPEIRIILFTMNQISPFGSSGSGNPEVCISKDRLYEELPPAIEQVKKAMGL